VARGVVHALAFEAALQSRYGPPRGHRITAVLSFPTVSWGVGAALQKHFHQGLVPHIPADISAVCPPSLAASTHAPRTEQQFGDVVSGKLSFATQSGVHPRDCVH